MRRRAPLRAALTMGLALCGPPVTARAQVPERSSVVELLDRITADINDLRYAEAIERGRPLVARVDDLPSGMRLRLHLLMAAAHFPEDPALQRADTSRWYLANALREAPDATYPAELRWRGLDSLLNAARASTPSAVLRPATRQPIGGPDLPARLSFVATPGTRTHLLVLRRSTGEVVHSDSATGERGEFILRAHDGASVILAAGVYDLVVEASAGAVGASHRKSYPAVVELPELVLEQEPRLASERLLPESARPDRARLTRTALYAGIATVALGAVGRRDGDLRAAFPLDTRAYVAGGAVFASVAWFARGSNEVAIPDNVAANVALRAAHDRAVADLRARNALRLARHVGTILVSPDAP